MTENWKKKFSASALGYGQAEFQKGRVSGLREENGNYSAAVLGIERYEVKLFCKDGEFVRGKCTCPVAKGGGCCGHMAAVLYAVNPDQAEKPKQEEKPKQAKKPEQEEKPKQTEKPEQSAAESGERSEEERRQRNEARQKRKEERKRREEERRRLAAEAREKEAGRVRQEQERRRKEEERAEEERKRREERKRLEDEARRIADEKRRQEEKARRAEERKRQQEKKARRAAEEARREEEERRRMEEAARAAAEQEERERAERESRKVDPSKYDLLGEIWEEDETGDGGCEQLTALEKYRYFHLADMIKTENFPKKTVEEGRRLLDGGMIGEIRIEMGYDRYTGEACVQAEAVGTAKGRQFDITVLLSRSGVLYSDCRCAQCLQDHERWYTSKTKCAYTAGLLLAVSRYSEKTSLADATDLTGQRFLDSFGKKRASRIAAEGKEQKETLKLEPKLVKKDGELELSFRVGSSKLYVIKELAEFCDKVKRGENGTYGKNTVINHQLSNFTERGKEWLRYIRSVVQEERKQLMRMNERLRNYSTAASVGGTLDLFGWRLDRFYEMLSAEERIDYEDRDRKEKAVLRIGEGRPEVRMEIRPLRLPGDPEIHGIHVEGTLPPLYYGTDTAYYIDGDTLKRTDAGFREKIAPFADISADGEFSFEVGRNHMSEFYYGVLPGLEDAAEVTEEEPAVIRSVLPPEVKFVFYLDAEDGDAACRVYARYAGRECSCAENFEDAPMEAFRDPGVEQEMLSRVMRWFPKPDPKADCLRCGGDEELIFRVMSEGVDELLKLGEVRCTHAFRNRQVVRRVKVSAGVSVSRGLLELEITTTDVPPEELMDVLKGYRQKKKYYRLRDGSFVSLEEDSLKMLVELAEGMRLKDKDLIKGKMHLPLYRTLYLDRMLEEHEEISAERDSRFREMVKGFKTISDSDFEVPKSLSKVMRNYQKTGYQWLRTLETWNFGGILADDMGLGKTLQMISVLLAAKEEGQQGTSLVVCPASLVFNWGEELNRFAPELKVTLVAGNQEERQRLIDGWEAADVLVTSYDLLRRDIALYEGKNFLYEVIDEAQYIKNHTTASAKAVKIIAARTRFALTGTPIENRLSELWSIFDYLMPGFLYSYEVFRKEMETPIVKNDDEEAAARLRKMTSPFILRRLKENVLKDLPEKLEEARYVRFEEKQQKLYDAQVLKLRESIEAGSREEFEKNRFRILAEITKLRQICCDPSLCFENYRGGAAKAEACVDLVKSAAEGGHRILLFSQFTSMLEILEQEFQEAGIGYYKITGETPKKERLSMVKSFNSGDTPLFLISLKAGGVGLNLTGADVVIHYDPWWNLAVQNQATDRAHRIGQTKKVTVYKLIAKNTIEEKIEKIQEAKKDLAGQILGGETGQLAGLGREELMELLELS